MGYYISYKDDLGGDPGVLEDSTKDSTTVVNWYTSDTYKEIVARRYQWQQEGLLLPNGSTNSESAVSLIKAGKAFSSITNTKPGVEAEIERSTGKPMTVIELVSPYSTTNNINNLWYVPHNSEKPERAVQVLNEMYTNPELANILIYGVEGKNYVVKDESKGLIDYPEGMDAGNKTYNVDPWAWPNEPDLSCVGIRFPYRVGGYTEVQRRSHQVRGQRVCLEQHEGTAGDCCSE